MILPTSLLENALQPPLSFALTLRTSVLWVWLWVGARNNMDTRFSVHGKDLSQEPGVVSCLSPNLTKVLMYRVAP